MAVNPMQRKARNSFLLGVLLTLLITGIVITLLFLQLKKMNDEKVAEAALKVNVYVLNKDVKSGQVLTQDMFTLQPTTKTLIPSNATSVAGVIDTWFLQTKDGEMIYTDDEGLYLQEDSGKTRVQEESTGNYYITKRDSNTREEVKQYLEINEVPVVAKIDMKKNTVVTPDLVVQSDEVVTDDVRREEYNMIVLPMDLATDDYIDIRLMMPNGQNFVVVSKTQVEVPENTDGTYVTDTIWANLREDEILALSSAIVEAHGIQGAKLYANKYAEPGLQKAATPTYVPNSETTALINSNPNVVELAKKELSARYSQTSKDLRNQYLQSVINNDTSYDANVKAGMQTDITNSESTRKQYLESLGN